MSLLVLGALPMANVLAVGILIGQRRPGSRPFLLGFEAFGAMALALFVAVLGEFLPWSLWLNFLSRTSDPLHAGKFIGHEPAFRSHPNRLLRRVVMLGWPQVVFALIGGFLSRRFKVTITRR